MKCRIYLCNIIGECNNLLSSIAADSRPEDSARSLKASSEYFSQLEELIEEMKQLPSATIPSYFAVYYRNAGTVFEKSRDSKKALSYYQKALSTDPNDYLSHRNIAMLALNQAQGQIDTGTVMDGTLDNVKNVLAHLHFYEHAPLTVVNCYDLYTWAYTLLGYLSGDDSLRKNYWEQAEESICRSIACCGGAPSDNCTCNMIRLDKYRKNHPPQGPAEHGERLSGNTQDR